MAIVFLDLDGTLLANGKPAKKARLALEKLHQNGHLAVAATGRVPFLAKDILADLHFTSHLCAAGSHVVHDGQVLFVREIEKSLLERFLAYCDAKNMDMVLECVDDYVAYRKETEIPDIFADYFHVPRAFVNREFHQNHTVLAFNIFDNDLIDDVRATFPEFQVNKAGPFGYDVNPAGDLKAEGMKLLVDYLKIPANEVYAIGDGHNDVHMIRDAYRGIAMGNAVPEAKAVADYITTDVSEGGVYDALVHFGLIE